MASPGQKYVDLSAFWKKDRNSEDFLPPPEGRQDCRDCLRHRSNMEENWKGADYLRCWVEDALADGLNTCWRGNKMDIAKGVSSRLVSSLMLLPGILVDAGRQRLVTTLFDRCAWMEATRIYKECQCPGKQCNACRLYHERSEMYCERHRYIRRHVEAVLREKISPDWGQMYAGFYVSTQLVNAMMFLSWTELDAVSSTNIATNFERMCFLAEAAERFRRCDCRIVRQESVVTAMAYHLPAGSTFNRGKSVCARRVYVLSNGSSIGGRVHIDNKASGEVCTVHAETFCSIFRVGNATWDTDEDATDSEPEDADETSVVQKRKSLMLRLMTHMNMKPGDALTAEATVRKEEGEKLSSPIRHIHLEWQEEPLAQDVKICDPLACMWLTPQKKEIRPKLFEESDCCGEELLITDYKWMQVTCDCEQRRIDRLSPREMTIVYRHLGGSRLARYQAYFH
jgi:hypothetical protein